MKQVLFLIVGIVIFGVSGCAEPFQPLPPASDTWNKPGADRVEVSKKLLECGMPDPFSGTPAYARLSTNALATIDFCMERAGFHSRYGDAQQWCRNFEEKNLAVCQPGAKIPAPSIKKRLNSKFCQNKTYKTRPECQP